MKKVLYALLLLLLLASAFWAGSSYQGRGSASKDHPSSGPTARTSDLDNEADSDTPGAVKITSGKQQTLGVQTGVVEKRPFTHTLRVLGRVSADETITHRMVAAAEGWIREVFPVTVGSFVKKNQPLATCYSRELLTLGQSYLSALTILDRFPDSDQQEQHILPRATTPRVTVHLAEDGLRSLGMGEAQIEEMRRTRQIVQYVTMVSPTSGLVLARNVFPSQWFDRGTELYRIADLSRVWIFADVYGGEARHFHPGMSVKVSLPDQPKIFPAKVSRVLPQFDPSTRTLKLRLEAQNPGYVMRPDMFVDVELQVQMPPAIIIPTDALLDSGIKKTVFVDQGHGYFEPRSVSIGWRLGNRVEILDGLAVGERIVVSGTFLIDSESRMELAAVGIKSASAKDPVCDLEVSIRKAEKSGLKSIFQGKTYYFSSETCRARFDKNPGQFAEKSSKSPPQ